MKWDGAKTGVMILAVTVAAVTADGAQERMRPARIGTFGWTAGHEPVRCDLAGEFATASLPVRGARRSDDARHRVRDGADISIEDWNNGVRRQSADRLGSGAALGVLSTVGGQQVTGTFTRALDHER